ncbi:L,D-transpeptidase family protein [Prosthecobacter sp.]|uniref:L,D-transpeptidase family protein n=1 Tax=Prosthecobacter sp. TaxID=1965333 RepID=UPI002AB9B76E|nr:L,D-transpeptidase family protein [Prosthecobacter sp.]MDZ4401764.1 L,D-transpeptidase family protein [Prosthecobacter sp.]
MKTHTFNIMATVSLLALVNSFTLAGEPEKKDAVPRTKAEMEAATRLQIFLDRAEFAPGKIDGHYGQFTVKALALFRQSRGEKAAPPPEKPDTAPDVSGIDLSSVDPLFLAYTVTEADLKNLGNVPDEVPAQAKLKMLTYQTAAEAIAEKFHTDVDFLTELNPGKTKEIQAGDTLSVPNVEPFDLTTVKDLKPGGELAANDLDDEAEAKDEPTETKTAVKIDTQTSMLTVHEEGKLIAAYPVTIGSEQTESPLGDWKVRGVAKMPNFRHDKAMLNKGERSDEFHILPPGPNNPAGVIWIALNKKGMGLHGTSDPDSIGRSASHGCVRLANWDVTRLAGKIKAGVPVAIH